MKKVMLAVLGLFTSFAYTNDKKVLLYHVIVDAIKPDKYRGENIMIHVCENKAPDKTKALTELTEKISEAKAKFGKRGFDYIKVRELYDYFKEQERFKSFEEREKELARALAEKYEWIWC